MTKAEIDLINAKCNDITHGKSHLVPHDWIDGPTQYVYQLQAAIAGAVTKLTQVGVIDVIGALSLLNTVKW